MATKKNGWKQIMIGAGVIASLGAAYAVLQPFVPWAPKGLVVQNFAAAAENTLDRWRTEYIKIKFLVEQSKNSGDRISQASWEKQLLEVQWKIKALEAEKTRRKQ